MKEAKPLPYQAVLEQLMACGQIKAWSLIVTILGDLAAEKGARVSGPALTQLTEPMGLKPEALRVAIHRLRRDGWLVSEREGRTSLYGLSDHGRTLTKSVFHRVYGAAPELPKKWLIVVAQNAEALQAVDHPELLPISPRTGLLADVTADVPEGVLAWAAEPGAMPGWVKSALVDEELSAAYGALLPALDAALKVEPPEGVMARAVLRLVALHQWRRLVLRHGAAAEALMGQQWAGAMCRARVTRLLALLELPEGELLRLTGGA
ncbi:PaaX family transcriptional regulator [Rhodobacteraceae bacterium D3-12]|nr:PaaX family transcriptional regulator [Rhodobacteraceae bacterium D3-12]